MKTSAPGKIILLGEHAVVYGRPALAVPVLQVHAEADIVAADRPGIWIHAPDIRLHSELNSLPAAHPIASVLHKFFASHFPYSNMEAQRRLHITITSTIPVAAGLGSGAAVTVALVRALAAHFALPLTDEEVNAFAYEIEKIHHGTPSGIDNTVITYAKPVYFIRGQPIETFAVGEPFTLVIGDTGIPAPTKESVAGVRKLWEADTQKWERVFDEVGETVKRARRAIEQGKTNELGRLMNHNHALLQQMTVSSPELERLVAAARKAGALGAKLSGGGRGGNMIALVEPPQVEAVVRSLKEAGAKNTLVTTVG